MTGNSVPTPDTRVSKIKVFYVEQITLPIRFTPKATKYSVGINSHGHPPPDLMVMLHSEITTY